MKNSIWIWGCSLLAVILTVGIPARRANIREHYYAKYIHEIGPITAEITRVSLNSQESILNGIDDTTLGKIQSGNIRLNTLVKQMDDVKTSIYTKCDWALKHWWMPLE